MTSTDAGPALFMQREPYNRVVDLNDYVWHYVTGKPLSAGIATVTVTYL